MPAIDRHTPASSVLTHPNAAAVINELAPEVLASPMMADLADFPVGPLLSLILGEDDARVGQILERASQFEDLTPVPTGIPAISPDPAYEADTTPRASASVEPVAAAAQNRRVDLVLHGPSHGNPFVDVDLRATFRLGAHVVDAGGFYDGGGIYRVRFLPPEAGSWEWVTASTARSLDGLTGTVEVAESDARGPVSVADQFHFAYADGTPFVPIGTTAYVWTLQDEALQDETVRSLAASPFTKVRMGLFPKSYLFNADDPETFPMLRDGENGWDTTRFDVEYFRRLERRIEQLEDLGIEADVILFHPYDRWGFAALGAAADDRYVSYVVRRLSAFPNVWWSMANEYDLLTSKRRSDWDRLAGIVQANDSVGHPLSIHNWVELFDYTASWATHCSIQRGDHAIGEEIARWRRRWGKPVIVDEFGYEGDIDQGWGNATSEEVVRKFWAGAVRGGYLTHGETYFSEDDVLWWSKGGTLRGDSPARLAFLRAVMDESPSGRLDPLPSDWDFAWGGVADRYIIIYFGGARPSYRTVRLPAGMTAKIDVIDTWDMTITELPGQYTGDVRIDLPAKPYIALRARSVEDAPA
jgi:hypothetical protein